AIELSLLLNTNMNDSSLLLIYAEAEKFLRQDKFEEASDLFKEIASNKQGFVLRHKAKLKEAEIKLAIGEIEESISLLREITSEKEQNIFADKALFLLGKIYQYGLKRSEEHTSELQSRENLVCRLLLEKKKK